MPTVHLGDQREPQPPRAKVVLCELSPQTPRLAISTVCMQTGWLVAVLAPGWGNCHQPARLWVMREHTVVSVVTIETTTTLIQHHTRSQTLALVREGLKKIRNKLGLSWVKLSLA